jgi:hypothetical protein
MTRAEARFPSNESLALLARILIPIRHAEPSPSPAELELKSELVKLRREELDEWMALAQSHHVIVRTLEPFLELMRAEKNATRTSWGQDVLAAERARIGTALHFLDAICAAFEEYALDVTVIKSLDHWPDLGSDLDLYTTGDPETVLKLMRERFEAKLAPRSWGDRLANKWNFFIPGLPEAVEVHAGRLGQTGEQAVIASALTQRTRPFVIAGYRFRIPSMSDRVMISALQRMYRHFNFRLCDIVDTTAAADAGAIDYEELRLLAVAAGIWEGVATYLRIVSDYAESYRGFGLELPQIVLDAVRFDGKEIYFDRGYLRVPILPHSVRLYGTQLVGVLGRGELHNGARLSLLPWLATAAAAKQRLTGSDKGIW